jgi:hypothetical protein
MKKQIAISLITVALAGTALAQSSGYSGTRSTATVYAPERQVTGFIEPSAIYVPAHDGSDDAFGGALSVGAIIHKHHMPGLDIAYFEADYDAGPGKMKFMPLTSSYQFALPLSKYVQVRPGVFGGAMFEKSKDRPGISNSNRTAFTCGASLGLDCTINKNVSIGVSGKWMHVNDVKDLRERDMALVGVNFSVKF